MDGGALARDLRVRLGAAGVVDDPLEREPFERGYRYGRGRARIVARPATTEELRAVVRYCYAHDLRLVAQGANTGLVGASTPDETGDQVLLSLQRMTGTLAVDPIERRADGGAGVRLSQLNAAAAEHGLTFPIDLAADPTLGGMVATNTGGARLIRHGDVRRSLLGLEVVLADEDATVLSDLAGLRKNNAGLDLKQLFCGSGGTLGIITHAAVDLQRAPRQTGTAMIALSDPRAAVEVLAVVEDLAGEVLAAFEGISAEAAGAALRHAQRLRNPFAPDPLPPYMILLELTSALPRRRLDLDALLESVALELVSGPAPLATDARLLPPPDAWALRHAVSDGLRDLGQVIAFDISAPRSRLPALRTDLLALVRAFEPQLAPCHFGHVGDGGDHFNVVWPHTAAVPYDPGKVTALRTLIYDRVHAAGGSFSAEHGLGPVNVHHYRRLTPGPTRTLARALKRAFDPKGLLGHVDLG